MRDTAPAGFLLLLVAFLGIAGFLSGNLDRWLAALFSPLGATAPGAAAPSTRASSTGQVTVGAATARATA